MKIYNTLVHLVALILTAGITSASHAGRIAVNGMLNGKDPKTELFKKRVAKIAAKRQKNHAACAHPNNDILPPPYDAHEKSYQLRAQPICLFGEVQVEKSKRIVYGIANPPDDVHYFTVPEKGVYAIVESAPGPLEEFAREALMTFEQAAINQNSIAQLRYDLLGQVASQQLSRYLKIALSKTPHLNKRLINTIFKKARKKIAPHNPFNNIIKASIVILNPVKGSATAIRLNNPSPVLTSFFPQGYFNNQIVSPQPRNSTAWHLNISKIPLTAPNNDRSAAIIMTSKRFGQNPIHTQKFIFDSLTTIDPSSPEEVKDRFMFIADRQMNEFNHIVEEQKALGVDDASMDASIPTNVLMVIPLHHHV